MTSARQASEAQIRAAILIAERNARDELAWALLCRDPKNVKMRRRNALIQQEIAAEYRAALAEHLLLDGKAYHPMPELVQ